MPRPHATLTLPLQGEIAIQLADQSLRPQLDAALSIPLLRAAVGAASLLIHPNEALHGPAVIELAELIARVNPRFPGDSFRAADLAFALAAEPLDVPSVVSYATVEATFPELKGRHVQIRRGPAGWVITVTGSISKDGPQRKVTFSSPGWLGLPLTVGVSNYTDMENPAGHSEYCEGGDCACEPQEAGYYERALTVGTPEEIAALGEWVAEQVEKDLFAGDAVEAPAGLNPEDPQDAYGAPTWAIEHGQEGAVVIAQVWERPEGFVFGYRYEWGEADGSSYESAPRTEIDARTAREYAMNGAGDLAVANHVEWHPGWQQWVETGEVREDGSRQA